MDPSTASSSERRSVKRRPAARSPELSPKAAGAGEGALRGLVEELEEAAARMRGEKEAAEEAAKGLRVELEAERAAAETAASEAMLMIERLQREKAAALMEARQFRRYAEGRADRDREVQDELASLSDLAASYHSRLQSHGIDPDATDEEEEETEQQIDPAALEADETSGASSSGMDVKDMVEGNEEEPESLSRVEEEFEYTVDVGCASAMNAAGAVVAEYVGEGRGGLYARVEALEAGSVAMRREMAALRAETAQLVATREMARRLCREMVAERRGIVKKAVASVGSFSVFRICKWVFSIIFSRNNGSTTRYTFGLSTTFLALLLLLDRSSALSPRRRLLRPQR